MLTLKDAKLTLMTIKLLGYVGVLPYDCNVKEGKLEELTYCRLIFWHLCAFLSTLNGLNSIFQAVNLYLLSDHLDFPQYIVLIHIFYTFGGVIAFNLVIYTTKTKPDVVTLLFNQLFTGEGMTNNIRLSSTKTKIVDLALRMLIPLMTFYLTVGWSLLLVLEPNIPIQPINSRLLEPLKKYRILVIIFGIVDIHGFIFVLINCWFLIFLLYLCCEKVRVDGSVTRDSLRFIWLNHRPVRRAMKKARSIQLGILLTNVVGCWVVFTQKIFCIFCCVIYGKIVVQEFSQNIPFGFFACGCCLASCFSWSASCYFANLVPKETQRLHRDISVSCGSFFRADVVRYMRSVRPGYVQDGSYRTMEQKSFLVFVDFVVQQLVAVLII